METSDIYKETINYMENIIVYYEEYVFYYSHDETIENANYNDFFNYQKFRFEEEVFNDLKKISELDSKIFQNEVTKHFHEDSAGKNYAKSINYSALNFLNWNSQNSIKNNCLTITDRKPIIINAQLEQLYVIFKFFVVFLIFVSNRPQYSYIENELEFPSNILHPGLSIISNLDRFQNFFLNEKTSSVQQNLTRITKLRSLEISLTDIKIKVHDSSISQINLHKNFKIFYKFLKDNKIDTKIKYFSVFISGLLISFFAGKKCVVFGELPNSNR